MLGALGAATAFIAAPANACTPTATVPTDLGSASPASVKAGVVPGAFSKAGLNCPASVIVVLGNNYIRAKFHSLNNFKLLNGASSVNYTASPDSGATVAFTQDQTVDYMQNNLLNILGLLGASNGDLPFYVKPSSATLPPVGTYIDKVTITWTWYICQGIGAFGACLGTPVSGTATTVVDLTLTVAVKAIVLTTTTSTTWDPINGALNPKSLPGGRKRLKVEALNPDLVAADINTIALNVAIPARTMIALDGDGTSSTFLQVTDSIPASGLMMIYTSPSSTSDDVDFSSDNGATWTYTPVAGNDTSQSAVTNVRLRTRGAMAAGANVSVSLPLKTK